MVLLFVLEKVSSTKRVMRQVLPTPASPTTSSLNVVEYWPPGVGSGSCDGLSFCLASVATSQNVFTCSKPAVVSRLPPKMMSDEESMAHAVWPASAQPG